MSFRIAIEGASGYSGMELTRILARHPGVELVAASSGRWEGSTVRARVGVHGPAGDVTYRKTLDTAGVDAVLSATPADASTELLPRWVEAGVKVIDLSNAYRADPEWVYGLTEHARERLDGARLVANPGCYPTATQLALLPLVAAGLLSEGPVVVDAKSGATGAGRKNADFLLFNELADNHHPYKVGSHQHVPEIERGLGREVLFTPHLLPCRRGLLVSAYVPVKPGTTAGDLEACLRERYASEPFVQVTTPDTEIGIARVVGTPNCRIAVGPSVKGGLARVFACEDNLLKGAASQAVQNLNRILGLEETAGLV